MKPGQPVKPGRPTKSGQSSRSGRSSKAGQTRYWFAGIGAATTAVVLGVVAAQPIYQTSWLWLVAAAALVIGLCISWAQRRWRLSPAVVIAVLLAAYMVTVVPVAVPQTLSARTLSAGVSGFVDGLAATALGWKQVLTLTLPVGTYRTTLVPLYVVLLTSAFLTMMLATRSRKAAVWAAVPMLAPVAFGTVFGASEVSGSLSVGPLTIAAPRETLLWLSITLVAAAWTAWTSSSDRRAALKLGRLSGENPVRRRGIMRAAVAGLIVLVCLIAGALFAPVLDSGARAVARDRVDPELVVRDRPSPLTSYRASKTDAEIDRVMFSVRADKGLPERLRLAVLDAYDGVDFHVSGGSAGLFTRFPSGEPLRDASTVQVTVGEGYDDIWAPTATLGSPPIFGGPRAEALSDGFYVNRETGAAIAFSGSGRSALGLTEGDNYSAEMEVAPAAAQLGDPISPEPLFDIESAPELAQWITAQGVSADAAGLATLIEALRERGYLSHSLTAGDGDTKWIAYLAEEYGTKFESSAGGHSLARIETLFTQLNQQQRAAGSDAREGMLVAAIGDDEQFAPAAALIAQALGYESRVVVGVRTSGDGVTGVPACDSECTGEALGAWIEVRGANGDWVTFDATPQAENRPQRLEEGEQLPEYPTSAEERDAREVDPPIGLGEQTETPEAEPENDTEDWAGPLLRTIGLSAGAAALIALPLLFLPVAKRLRARSRRRQTHPELQALGAWAEMVDRARDTGVDVPDHATRQEIAAVLATRPAIWAAGEVDRAVFAADTISPEQAVVLWDAMRADGVERRQSMTLWQRLCAQYSLRSYGVVLGRRGVRALEEGRS